MRFEVNYAKLHHRVISEVLVDVGEKGKKKQPQTNKNINNNNNNNHTASTSNTEPFEL